MKFTANTGSILLAIYLFIVGIGALIPSFTLPPIVYGLVAIAAGVFIILGK